MVYRLETLTGAKFNTVSFKSGSETVTAVLGGHIHATAENLGEVMPHVGGGKLRLLGVPAMKRPAGLPNVPTMKEQGFDIHAGGYRSFVAPAGVSPEVVKIWDTTLEKVHKSAGWKDYMARSMVRRRLHERRAVHALAARAAGRAHALHHGDGAGAEEVET